MDASASGRSAHAVRGWACLTMRVRARMQMKTSPVSLFATRDEA